MKIVINGKEVALREKEVRIAKKAINRLLQTMKEGAVENNMPTPVSYTHLTLPTIA